ncbi:peptidase S41 [Mucilaginibacter robiniae]|uniref:Peptidase S41 n=1 Tax=Mucilaginibacter robiniae TaxID=2728022 RepID=A0A7L5E719_9SPHI|nr:S41 family peptidase [Mucilaginibacter robiniae]QJD98187.1 peptidase S41 [Mucilaginibacter robiniae]
MKLLKKSLLLSTLAAACFHAHAQAPNTLKPQEKVYGLSKFWQEVNYNFVYLDKVDRKAWDSLYTAMIPIVEHTPNDYEYYRELQRFCAFLNDGHTNIYFPNQMQQTQIMTSMFGKYRLVVENIDGRAIITHTNLSIKDEVPTGSEIVSVNKLPTDAYINQFVKPYIPSSTDYVREDNARSGLLRGFVGDRYDITIKTPKGQIKNLALTHAQTEEKELYPTIADFKLLDFKWYPGQIAYLALNSFEDQKIDSLFIQQLPELRKAKALIIDLRQNGGGSTSIGTAILDYLTDSTVLHGSKMVSRLHVASYKAWGNGLTPKDTVHSDWAAKAYLDNHDLRTEVITSSSIHQNRVKEPKIVVPTAILTSHNTASSAEDFLIFADKQPHMVKIGQNTFGSTGQPYNFLLPGGGSARVCTKKDTYPDGREFVGYGVHPDIEVKPTVKDFIQNNDPVLNKALSYLKGKTLNNIRPQNKELSK